MNVTSWIKDFFCCETKERYFSGKAIGPLISVYVFSLILGLKPFNPLISKDSIWFLIVGFVYAAIRSWHKDWQVQRRKPLGHMVLPYFVNYPIALGTIYVIMRYSFRESSVYYVFLFLLGFHVDDVFKEFPALIRALSRRFLGTQI